MGQTSFLSFFFYSFSRAIIRSFGMFLTLFPFSFCLSVYSCQDRALPLLGGFQKHPSHWTSRTIHNRIWDHPSWPNYASRKLV